MPTVLVAGGAGRVGSHCCLALAEAGFRPVVYDDLSNGHREHVQWGPLEVGYIRDAGRLDAVFAPHASVAILHFATRIEVGESVKDPGVFFDNNVGDTIALVETARRAGVNAIVFSSTCATFGDPVHLPMAEDQPEILLNPYGRSKLIVEQALADYDGYLGFRSAVMRYFNAAGADPEGRIGDWHEPEPHAITLALQVALGQRSHFSIFGDNYDTGDGTAVRDYLCVLDLADAHVSALRRLLAGGSSESCNLGTGTGTTVCELVDGVGHAVSKALPVQMAERRAGDAPVRVGDNSKGRDQLGWRPSRDLDAILSSAWRWDQARAERGR